MISNGMTSVCDRGLGSNRIAMLFNLYSTPAARPICRLHRLDIRGHRNTDLLEICAPPSTLRLNARFRKIENVPGSERIREDPCENVNYSLKLHHAKNLLSGNRMC
jgi:hypothetical protein